MSGKYMAYVGSYSYTGKAKGITVFDAVSYTHLNKSLLIKFPEKQNLAWK